jgi:hypothetical protein
MCGDHLGPSVRRYLGRNLLEGQPPRPGAGNPAGSWTRCARSLIQMPFTATDLRMIGCPTLWHAQSLLACTSGHSGHASRPRLTASDPVRVGDRMILGGRGIKRTGDAASKRTFLLNCTPCSLIRESANYAWRTD